MRLCMSNMSKRNKSFAYMSDEVLAAMSLLLNNEKLVELTCRMNKLTGKSEIITTVLSSSGQLVTHRSEFEMLL